MIKVFVSRFMAAKPQIEAELRKGHPENYEALVRRVIDIVKEPEGTYEESPDPERITVIDHGDYQGTQLYIIGARGYQPSVYWSLFVDYGSCSVCDTLERIKDYSGEPPNDEQVKNYWTLMLHMVQELKVIGRPDETELLEALPPSREK